MEFRPPQYRIPPVPLRYVNERYYPGVFGDFTQVVEAHLGQLRRNSDSESTEKARFFEYLLTQVDAERYAELQDAYLRSMFHDQAFLKYLDAISWFEHKLSYAYQLELDKKPPTRILDLGTGPGHFLVIARFYGHEAIGTEIPGERWSTNFYDELAELYRIERIRHRVLPYQELSDLPSGFQLVTAFSVAFNCAYGGKPWDRDAWDFFLRSLNQHVLAARGALFMTLMKEKLTKESWDYLVSKAKWVDGREFQVLIERT